MHHNQHRANVNTIKLESVQKMQKTFISYLMRIKYDDTQSNAPIIRYFTTFNLKKTLISSLINVITKEYVHIEVEQLDDAQYDELNDDIKTQWNGEDDDGDEAAEVVINEFLNEYESFLEVFLCSFPSLNPLSVQRMLQKNLNIRQLTNMKHHDIATTFPFLSNKQIAQFVRHSNVMIEVKAHICPRILIKIECSLSFK